MDEYRRDAVQRLLNTPGMEAPLGSTATALGLGLTSTPAFSGRVVEMVQVKSEVRGKNGETIMIWVPRHQVESKTAIKVDAMKKKTVRKMKKIMEITKAATTLGSPVTEADSMIAGDQSIAASHMTVEQPVEMAQVNVRGETGDGLLERFRRLGKKTAKPEESSKTGKLLRNLRELPVFRKKTPTPTEPLLVGNIAEVGDTAEAPKAGKTPQTEDSSKAADPRTPRTVPEMPSLALHGPSADSGVSPQGQESEGAEYVLASGYTSFPSIAQSPQSAVAGPSRTTSGFPSVPTTSVGEGSSAWQTRSPTVESVDDSEDGGKGKGKMPELPNLPELA